MHIKNRLALILTLLLFLSFSCRIPGAPVQHGFLVALDAPQYGSIYFVSDEISISAISQPESFDWTLRPLPPNPTDVFRFFVDGMIIGERSASFTHDPSAPNSKSAGIHWIASGVGLHLLQAEAIYADPTSERGGVSSSISICVLDIPAASIREVFSEFTTIGTRYEGPCPFDEGSPVNPQSNSFSMEVSASPNHEILFWTPECEATSGSLDMNATTVDPGDQLALLLIHIDVAGVVFAPLALTLRESFPSGGGTYSGTTYLSNLDVFGASTLHWSAYAYRRDGSLITSQGVFDIPVRPCTS